jgi:hypothetical protein
VAKWLARSTEPFRFEHNYQEKVLNWKTILPTKFTLELFGVLLVLAVIYHLFMRDGLN